MSIHDQEKTVNVYKRREKIKQRRQENFEKFKLKEELKEKKEQLNKRAEEHLKRTDPQGFWAALEAKPKKVKKEETKTETEANDIEDITKTKIKELTEELRNHIKEIEKRMTNKQWFQDDNKNNQKIKAINELIQALKDEDSEKVQSVLKDNNDILRGSTSTLPTFFQSKVTTSELLNKYQDVLDASTSSQNNKSS